MPRRRVSYKNMFDMVSSDNSGSEAMYETVASKKIRRRSTPKSKKPLIIVRSLFDIGNSTSITKSTMGNNSKDDSHMEENSPASGDDTDVSPPPEEPVTESGDFPEQWIETKCVFCGIELKDFHEPKLLQCLHSACKTCLSESSASPAPTSSGLGLSAKQLFCPTCNQDISSNEVIDHLFLLEHLSQNVEGLQEESKSYPCSCDEGAEASGFCTDCQEWLCDACVTAHHRVRVTKDHVIRPKDEMEGEKPPTGLNQKYLFCPLHSHEPLKLYCESCDKLTCRDCQLSDHKEHKYQFLTNACEEEKSSLNMILSKIKEKQQHIETACSLVNKRHEEISQRELAVTQEIKTFAVKFITEINKRGKQLLQELADVCSEKKTQLSFKNQELINMTTKLSYCKKFAEAALSHGSETALVYSKKVIIGQLKRILKHRCEVPNPSHNVDIMFSYEGNYLTQYISQLGTLLVDQFPVPRVSLGNNAPAPPQPPPQPQQPPPQPTQRIMQQSPAMHQNTQNMNAVRQMNQQLVPVNRNNSAMVPHLTPQMKQQQMQMQQQQQQKQQQMQMLQKQQLQAQKMQMQQKQAQTSHYSQPQVTSSTDHAQNRTAPQNNMRQMAASNQLQTFSRNQQVQRTMPMNMNQAQNQNFNVANNNANNFIQRHITQQSPVRQPAPQPQQPAQQFNQPMQMPQMLNSNITISPIGGPTPPKQRAMAPPRQNLQMSPISSQKNNMQRVGNVQQAMVQQQQPQRGSQPQVIEIDADGPLQRKTPTMSNTNRLSHFPAAAQAAIAANPGLQIQPINTNNFNNSGSAQPVQQSSADNEKNLLFLCGGNIQVNVSSVQNKLSSVNNAAAAASLDEFTKSVISEYDPTQESKNDNTKPVADSTVPTAKLPAVKNFQLVLQKRATNPSEQKNVNVGNVKIGELKSLFFVPISSNSTVSTTDKDVRNISKVPASSAQLVILPPSSTKLATNPSTCFTVTKFISTERDSNAKSAVSVTGKQSSVDSKAANSNETTGNVIIEEPSTSSDALVPSKPNTITIKEVASCPLPESSLTSVISDQVPELNSASLPPGLTITPMQDNEPTSVMGDVEEPSSPDGNIVETEVSVEESIEQIEQRLSKSSDDDLEENDDYSSDDGLIDINDILEGKSAIKNELLKSSIIDSLNVQVESKEEEKGSSIPPIVMKLKIPQSDVMESAQVDPNEDYCSVCRDGGDLLCCSKCPRVFHVTCHVPAYPKIPSGEWFCRMCEDVRNTTLTEDLKSKRRKLGLSGRDLLFCERILLEVYCNSQSAPFHTRITKSTPGYYAIIKKPMDLSLVRLKLSMKHNDHYQSVEEFVADIRLMLSNCRLYNGKGSPLFDVAVEVEKFFDKNLFSFFPDFTGEQAQSIHASDNQKQTGKSETN